MMKVWLCIISISFFITAGSCLKCDTCKSDDKADCKGLSVTCDASDKSCMSALLQVIRPDDDDDHDDDDDDDDHHDIDTLFAKSCAEEQSCSGSYSVTIGTTHVDALTACCTTDNCAKSFPAIPKRNLTGNGFQCPVCFSYGVKDCTPTGNMNCTGLETKCTTYSGPLYVEDEQPNGSYQGCGTPSSCHMPLDPNSHAKITCSDPTKP